MTSRARPGPGRNGSAAGNLATGGQRPDGFYLLSAADLLNVYDGQLMIGPSGRLGVLHGTGPSEGSTTGLITVDTDLGRLTYGPTESVLYRP